MAIDVNGFFGHWPMRTPGIREPEEYLRAMDRFGIEAALVTSTAALLDNTTLGNDQIARLVVQSSRSDVHDHVDRKDKLLQFIKRPDLVVALQRPWHDRSRCCDLHHLTRRADDRGSCVCGPNHDDRATQPQPNRLFHASYPLSLHAGPAVLALHLRMPLARGSLSYVLSCARIGRTPSAILWFVVAGADSPSCGPASLAHTRTATLPSFVRPKSPGWVFALSPSRARAQRRISSWGYPASNRARRIALPTHPWEPFSSTPPWEASSLYHLYMLPPPADPIK